MIEVMPKLTSFQPPEQVNFLFRTVNLNFGKFSFSPSYLQAGLIILLLFVLILTLAQMRRHFFSWSIKGAVFGLFMGFLLALILEGFLVIGGRTAVTEVLGWKNAPKPIQIALDKGQERLVKVLGIKTAISVSSADEKPSVKKVLELFNLLSPLDRESFKSSICRP